MVFIPILFWAFWSIRSLIKDRFFIPRDPSDYVHSNLGLSHLIGAFSLFFVSYLVFVPYMASQLGETNWKQVLGLLLFATLFAVYAWSLRRPLKPYFTNPGFFKGVKTWVYAFPLILIWSSGIEFILSYFFNLSPTDQTAVSIVKKSMENPPVFITLVFFIACVVPALEELLFRGFLQNWLRQEIGPKGAIIITSAVFALFHYSALQGSSNIVILSSLFLLALFLGFLMEQTKSLRAPIGLHMTYNFISMLFIIIKESFEVSNI